MQYTYLPNSTIKISKICLGTMTFGEQNTEEDAHNQLDIALEHGINFIDTAEMYPIASRAETLGKTEQYIGTWFKKTNNRSKIVLATKIAGPNRGMDYIRKPLDFSKKNLTDALHKSLQNLQTDYIDLYQLHWPERKMNMFGQRGFTIVEDQYQDNFLEVLQVIDTFIKEGKIKQFGVSNEAPYGILRFLEESKQHNLPKISTIQNPFSLLNRLYEVGLAEICHHKNIGLMAYSPLAFGSLTGKHLHGKIPNTRIGLFPQFTRYSSENAILATKAYQDLAHENGLTLTQLALAFVYHNPFVMSTILGATSTSQLVENINAFQVILSENILKKINIIQEKYPNPGP
jgi:aryl-alcohol dehydrogenase-like predicted oxidoreductase